MIPDVASAVAKLGPKRFQLCQNFIGCWLVVDVVSGKPMTMLYVGREAAEQELERIRTTGKSDLARAFEHICEQATSAPTESDG